MGESLAHLHNHPAGDGAYRNKANEINGDKKIGKFNTIPGGSHPCIESTITWSIYPLHEHWVDWLSNLFHNNAIQPQCEGDSTTESKV